MPVVKDHSSLVAKDPMAVLAGVSTDVLLPPAVPNDAIFTATGTEYAVGPPDHHGHLDGNPHIGKQCHQK